MTTSPTPTDAVDDDRVVVRWRDREWRESDLLFGHAAAVAELTQVAWPYPPNVSAPVLFAWLAVLIAADTGRPFDECRDEAIAEVFGIPMAALTDLIVEG